MELGTAIALIIVALFLGAVIGVAVLFFVPFFKNKKAQNNADKIIRDAEIKAEHIQKNAKIDAKSTINDMKIAAENEIRERKAIVADSEKKLNTREASIDRRDQALLQKENSLDQKKEEYENKIEGLKKREIAEKLGISEKTVERHMSIALSKLREELNWLLQFILFFSVSHWG